MPQVLSANAPGRVVQLPDSSLPATITPIVSFGEPNPFSFADSVSIIDEISIAQQENVQFLYTLGGAVFVYSFGQQIGDLTISGVSFNSRCADGSSHGILRILDWYNENRISQRRAPVRVSIGNANPFNGFVVSMQARLADTKRWTIRYSISIALVAQRSS